MADPTFSDVIVIPVHNRRETTLRTLRALADDGVFGWAAVLVVDDGSTDGTAGAGRAEFPAVHWLQGDGTWWWAGAIRRGMEWALASGAARIFWLNDDCIPPRGGLARLRDFVARENTASWIDAQTSAGRIYGAHRKTLMRVRRCTPEEERSGKVDTFSGNCVCLPRQWVERVGLPDDRSFPHGLADFDYGLRLRTAGAVLRPLPDAVAVNAEPAADASASWLRGTRPMRSIWRDFSSPRSFFYFPAWRKFALRHWGPVWGWAVFLAPYKRWVLIAAVRTVVPGLGRARAQARTSGHPPVPKKT